MPNRQQNKDDVFIRLREKAEALLRERPEPKRNLKDKISELIEELLTYQTELEIQKKELQRAQSELSDRMSERKGTQETLARHSELLKRIFDKIPVLLVMWDPRLESFTLNRHAESVLGWTTEDANEGEFMRKLFPDAEYRAGAESYMKSLKSGWREWIATAKNGEPVPADWANIRLSDDSMIGIGVDLRERKRAEKAIRESERKYRVLIENANEGILVAQDGMLRYVNAKALEISGYSFEEMTSRPFSDFIHPDDRDMVMRNHRSRVKGEIVPSYTFRMVDKSGAVKWIELEGAVTTWEDRPAAFGFLADVTERRRVEKELLRRDAILAALGGASEQLWKSSAAGEGVRNMLKMLVQATGVSRAYIFENHLGKEGTLLTSQRYEWAAPGICSQLNNPDLNNFDWMAGGMIRWLRSLSQGAPIQGLVKNFPESEREVLAPQGIVSIMVVPVFVGNHWWGFVGFDDCATERTWSVAETEALRVAARAFGAFIYRKNSEEKLRRNKMELRRLASRLSVTEERERKRLARDLHDSIGQTLAIAKMKLTALLGSPAPTRDSQELADICECLGRALQDTRTLTFELYPPALHELGIKAALECLAERMRQTHGIGIELSFRGEPGSLSEDIAAFCYRATQELLVNVVKHSGAEKATVLLACGCEKIDTVVEDNGKGFSPSKGISRKDGQDGFGLFSIGERIHHFGGSFNVYSEPGTGTKVTFSVPVSNGGPVAERIDDRSFNPSQSK